MICFDCGEPAASARNEDGVLVYRCSFHEERAADRVSRVRVVRPRIHATHSDQEGLDERERLIQRIRVLEAERDELRAELSTARQPAVRQPVRALNPKSEPVEALDAEAPERRITIRKRDNKEPG